MVNASTSPVFEDASVPPPDGRQDFSLYAWEKVRDRGIHPQFHSGYSDDPELRREFLVGARMMGLELVDLDDKHAVAALSTMRPPRKPIQPQQLRIVDTLNRSHDAYVVEIVRRASKTTTIFCWLLGRLKSRPGYMVTFSAQNGVAGSRRLREWAGTLDAINPPDDLDLPPWLRGKPRVSKRHQRAVALFGDDLLPADEEQDDGRRGFRIMRGEVGKGIYFDNGSQMLVLKPDADAYRGEAADVSWLDEAQEIDPEEGDALLAGILPLQDTKPGAAIVISGTAGEARVGPFWGYVDRLRNGDPDVGGIDYAAPEDTPWEVIEDEDQAMELLQQIHPGIGTLTTLEKMAKNYRGLPKPQWAREYLSIWPETFGVRVVPAEQWADAALLRKVAKPPRVAFGMAIKPGGSVSAIVAAWRNAKGEAYIEVVEHRQGTTYLPKRMQELTRTYRGASVAYDNIAEGAATATETQMLTPKPKLQVQTYYESAAGCVQFLRELERGNLHHFDQAGLNAAVDRAGKREVRNGKGIWLWTPVTPGDDIVCLDAATKALRNWDQHFANRRGGSKSIMGE